MDLIVLEALQKQVEDAVQKGIDAKRDTLHVAYEEMLAKICNHRRNHDENM